MDSMFGRLRPSSKIKKNNLAPSKEDILNAIDRFDRSNVEEQCHSREEGSHQGAENNNNLKSQLSEESVHGRWDMLLDESPSASFSSSYSQSKYSELCDWEWRVIIDGAKYSSEWERLFVTPNYKSKLKDHGTAGRLRSSRFRSVVWKIYLDVLPADLDLWESSCQVWRNKYEDLKNRLIVNPRKAVDQVDISLNNPLSQDDESPWNKFFQDNELRLTIKQDVIRTFPELEFFKSPRLQEMMLDVLFCFCRSDSTVSYKQGMHELLAPLIFVLHCDHQAFLHASEVDTLQPISPKHREIVKVIMDPKYLESDAYAMFCKVMETVEPWYMAKEIDIPKPSGLVSSQPFSRPQDLNPSNVIVAKLTRIQDYILKKFDPELHQHLERLDIAPQVYGIRWVRLLFGREFPMQDLLAMWDAIFADGIGFDLVDYIFVSMLLYIRDVLLASDYVSCLGCLMKFPPVGDVHYFVEQALYLREPNQYPKPPKYTYTTVNQPAMNRSKNNKASPVVPEGKRGSTASLSQVEDSMFRKNSSSNSLIRLDPGHRSTQSTPAGHSPSGLSADEGVIPGFAQDSPPKYSTLPARVRNKNKKITKTDAEVQQQMAHLQGQLNDKSTMCKYCASKLDIHIDRLQSELMKLNLDADDEIMLSLAGIKQVRDVLNGTLKFSQNLLDEDEIAINDDFYKEENLDSHRPQALLVDATTSVSNTSNTSRGRQGKLFYMSSDDTPETSDSPESFSSMSLSQSREKAMELEDYVRKKQSNGPQSSFLSDSASGCGDSALTCSLNSSSSHNSSVSPEVCDVSPNPLYGVVAMDTDAV